MRIILLFIFVVRLNLMRELPTLYYIILYYSNVNVLRNDNNVARVKSKRIETSICSIINIKLSTPIFGLPMLILNYAWLILQ